MSTWEDEKVLIVLFQSFCRRKDAWLKSRPWNSSQDPNRQE